MSDTVIEVENLSKKYIIGHQKQERYTALRDVIADGAKAFWRSLSGGGSGLPENKEEFWALKDVSFEVKQGECIGIIGRNGAGKSTLLKILSRITEPTTGQIKIKGRVASLLEVGTGFHNELTGRENIFLNGSILGMSRAEIKAKFDEIVDFAEVERFLDTPVKFYSSGMYVRLAFAVAAHLETEILIVDEVLAVGDAAFQKKCLGKMGDVAKNEGKTILFVSHNMTVIANLCSHGFFLKKSNLVYFGLMNDTINRYLNESLVSQKEKRDSGTSIIRRAEVSNICEVQTNNGFGWIIEFLFEVNSSQDNLGIDFIIKYEQTSICFGSSAYYSEILLDQKVKILSCKVGPLNLAIGKYTVDIRVCEPMKKWIEEHDSIVEFYIEKQISSRYHFELTANRQLGFVIPNQYWQIK